MLSLNKMWARSFAQNCLAFGHRSFTMAQTDRQTNRWTWQIVDQIGPEGLFCEKMCDFCLKQKKQTMTKLLDLNKICDKKN